MKKPDKVLARRATETVEELIAETLATPMNVYGITADAAKAAADEVKYLKIVGGTYIRTVLDILSILPPPAKSVRILEIGAYQGIVSRSLTKLGYSINVFDIPDILQSETLRARYDKVGVSYTAGDLIQGELPFPDATFDCVIICEVIEHLNFNPLPTLLEINRVTKKAGLLYVGMPNQARLGHRVRAFLGSSIHEPVDLLFRLYCDPTFRVGLHWREYTMAETRNILYRLGYKRLHSYYFAEEDVNWPSSLSGWLRWLPQTLVPSFKNALVFIGRKESEATVTWPAESR